MQKRRKNTSRATSLLLAFVMLLGTFISPGLGSGITQTVSADEMSDRESEHISKVVDSDKAYVSEREYIESNIDGELIKEIDKFDMVTMFKLKTTIFESSILNDDDTLDYLMDSFSPDETMDGFRKIAMGAKGVYNLSDDSDYYVTLMDTTIGQDNAEVRDVIFAINNMEGEVLDNIVHDKATGLIYIPKALYEVDGEFADNEVQAQTLVALDNYHEAARDIALSLNGRSKVIKAVNNRTTLTFPIIDAENGDKISIDSLQVFDGENEVDVDFIHYNAKQGRLTVEIDPVNVSQLRVEFTEKSLVDSIKEMFSPKVKAVTSEALAFHNTKAYKLTPDALQRLKDGTLNNVAYTGYLVGGPYTVPGEGRNIKATQDIGQGAQDLVNQLNGKVFGGGTHNSWENWQENDSGGYVWRITLDGNMQVNRGLLELPTKPGGTTQAHEYTRGAAGWEVIKNPSGHGLFASGGVTGDGTTSIRLACGHISLPASAPAGMNEQVWLPAGTSGGVTTIKKNDRVVYGTYTFNRVLDWKYNPGGKSWIIVASVSKKYNDQSMFGAVKLEVETPEEDGYLSLLKHGETGNALSGANFTIYNTRENAEAGGSTGAIQNIVTGSNGRATSGKLKAGRYYVRETQAPAGYNVNTTVYGVTVEPEKTAQVNGGTAIKNVMKKGQIAVRGKFVPSGSGTHGAQGVVFNIYSNSGLTTRVGSMTTDKYGDAISSQLPIGRYYVQEAQTQSVNLTPLTTVYTVDVTEGGIALINGGREIKNVAPVADVQFKKGEILGYEDLSVYSNAQFQLRVNSVDALFADSARYGSGVLSNNDGEPIIVSPDANGDFGFERLNLGSYTLEEVSSGINGVPKNPQGINFTVVARQVGTTTVGVIQWGTNNSKSGAISQMQSHYSKNGFTAPSVSSSADQGVFYNYLPESFVVVNKFDADTRSRMTGVEFTLDQVGGSGSNRYPLTQVKNTDNSGTVKFGPLKPYQEYRVYESKVPAGYEATNFNSTFTPRPGVTETFNFDVNNEPIKINFSIDKKDLEGNELNIREFDGVQFRVRSTSLVKDAHTVTNQIIDETITVANGVATTPNIPLGIYEVTEVYMPPAVAEKYKDISGAKIIIDATNQNNIVVQDNNTVQLGLADLQGQFDRLDSNFTADTALDASDKVFANVYKYGIIKIDKQRAGTGEALRGAIFEISGGPGNYYSKEYTTDNNGMIVSEPLRVGTYTVREIQPAKGFGFAAGAPQTHTVEVKEAASAASITPTRYEYVQIDNDFVVNQPVEIRKQNIVEGDHNGDVRLDGAEFDLFMIEPDYPGLQGVPQANDKIASYVTDADGKFVIPSEDLIQAGTYKLVETKAPDGFLVNPNPIFFTITVDPETGWTTTTYSVDAKDNTIALEQELDSMHAHLTKVWNNLLDSEAPEQVYTPEELGIEITKTAEYTQEHFDYMELPEFGRVEISKNYDSDTELPLEKEDNVPEEGVVFEIYSMRDGALVDTLVTNHQGRASSKYLPYGQYVMKQVSSLDPSINKVEDQVFAITEHRQVLNYNLINEAAQMRLRIVKKDADTGKSIFQEGVIFELYAAEDIINPLTGKVKYEKDEKVKFLAGIETFTELVTNSKGETTSFQKLLAGNYYLKEIKGPNGYFVNGDEKFAVKIPNESELQAGVVNTIEITLIPGVTEDATEIEVENKPQYGELVIQKSAEQLTGWTSDVKIVKYQEAASLKENEVKKPQANVALVLRSEFDEEYEKQVEVVEMIDKTFYDYKVVTTVIDSEGGNTNTVNQELDENEYKANKALVDLVNKAVAEGQSLSDGIQVVSETEADGVTTIVVTTVKSKIVKVNSGTPSYKVEIDTRKAVTTEEVRTDADGKFSRTVGPGSYMLKDSKGNVLATLDVAEGDTGVIEVALPDEISTEQEYVYGDIIDKKYSVQRPVYEVLPLKGAKFEVIAAEDINSFDGQTEFYREGDKLIFASEDIIVDGKVVYEKGDVISAPILDESILEGKTQDYIETGAAKDTVATRVPLGKYKVVEIEAPLGFKKDATINEIEFEAQDQTIEIVKKSPVEVENERQIVTVKAVKDLLEKRFPEGQTPEHIVLGLYAKENIGSLAAGSMIDVANPDKDGNVVFEDVPAGKFYIKEVNSLNGYELNETEYEVESSYVKDLDEDIVEDLDEPIVNKPNSSTTVLVKVDEHTGEKLPGVQFKLWKVYSDGSKELVMNDGADVWITDENGEIHVPGLDDGNYEWEEVETLPGYIDEGTKIQISVGEDSNVEVTVGNHPSEMSFIKIDAETGKPVHGAKMALLHENGDPVKVNDSGYVVHDPEAAATHGDANWISGDHPHVIRGLEVGKTYQLVELEAPEGYAQAKPVVFTVDNVVGLQLSSMNNKFTDVRVIKRDWSSGEPVHGATLEIREVDKDGIVGDIAVDKVTGKPVVWTTGPGLEDGFIIRGLKVGQLYEVVETQVPEGYLPQSEDITMRFTVLDTEDIQTIVVVNEPIPNVGTKAAYIDGSKENLPEDNLVIIDIVSLDKLVVGQTYRVDGQMVNADDPSEVFDSESVTFVATATSMEIKVKFVVDLADLEGTTLVAFEQLFRYGRPEEDGPIAKHEDPTDRDQNVYVPEIGTVATDKIDGAHDALATDEVTIVDIVRYTNLEPNKEHKVVGKLMSKTTGQALLINGEEVIAETVFTTDETGHGEVAVEFTFNAAALAGETLVVFEEMFNASGKLIAEHKDIEDKEQSVYIPEIGTSAVNKEDGTKEVSPEREAIIVDTLEYKNLIEGETYTAVGILMDKETGEPLLVDGKEVTSSKEFVAESADGSIELEFVLDPTGLNGKELVVFEEVFNINGKLVGEHKDIEDEKQTVYVPNLGTTASLEGADQADENRMVTIHDIVEYENLIVGKEYTVEGFLMDKETGEALLIDGEKVVETLTFVPEETHGTIEMAFVVPMDAVAGKTLVVFEGLYRDNKEVVLHHDINDEAQTVDIPEVSTSAKFDDDNKESNPLEELTIIDRVTYKGLEIGKEYTVNGVLMDKETGMALIVDGKEVTSTITFVVEASDGYIDLAFTVPGEAVRGKTLVVFESLLHEDKLVAIHHDIEDEAQTVRVTDPKVGTTATVNGQKSAVAAENMTIVDRFEYEGLVVGKTYIVKGILMDKATGSPLLINGKTVEAETEFTALTPDGFVLVEFNFDGRTLGGKELVVFEKLFEVSIDLDGNRVEKFVESHEDINDKGQTVKIDKPKNPVVQTSDGSNGMTNGLAPIAMSLIAGLALVLLAIKKKEEEATKVE